MVYLRGVFAKIVVIFLMLIVMMMMITTETNATRIAYKKPIFGKASNIMKETRMRFRQAEGNKTPALKTRNISHIQRTFIATTIKSTVTIPPTTTTTKYMENLEGEVTPQQEYSSTAGNNTQMEITTTTMIPEISKEFVKEVENDLETIESSESKRSQELNAAAATAVIDKPSTDTTPSTTAATTTINTTTLIHVPIPESNYPVTCTCGVFLASQVQRGINSNEPPIGAPVIINELERSYPCNAIGQKQCQTKCLETIVQHLPNSANILCATLDRDCHKERAYLFIKNCRNHWVNTKLTAGREYCCRNGQPYTCPLL